MSCIFEKITVVLTELTNPPRVNLGYIRLRGNTNPQFRGCGLKHDQNRWRTGDKKRFCFLSRSFSDCFLSIPLLQFSLLAVQSLVIWALFFTQSPGHFIRSSSPTLSTARAGQCRTNPWPDAGMPLPDWGGLLLVLDLLFTRHLHKSFRQVWTCRVYTFSYS